MVDIQIITNSGNETTPKTYWRKKDTDEFLPDGVTPNPDFGLYTKPSFLAEIMMNWTLFKFPANGTDPLKSEVIFDLMPFQDFEVYQVVVKEADTNYQYVTNDMFEADTEIVFDVYFKHGELGVNVPQLENLITQIQSIWMNYQGHEINGLAKVTIKNKFVDPDLARASATSNYQKSLYVSALYYIQKTIPVEGIAFTYSNPDIAGEYRTN